MRTRTLGGSTTTAIGFGEVSLARAAQRNVDVNDVERALHTGLSLGISFVDLAPERDAELLVANAVRELRVRDRTILGFRVPWLVAKAGAFQRYTLVERLPPPYLQEQVEMILRTTRLDVLPLVQIGLMAPWRSSSVWPELVGRCARLVQEGKVLAWGGVVEKLPQLDLDIAGATELASEPWLASLRIPFSACERALAPVFGGTATIIANRPLAGGALAGSLGPGVKLALRDDRNFDDATLVAMATGAAKLSRLVRDEPPAARSCDSARAALDHAVRPEHFESNTVADLALRYVIDRGALVTPRLHRREHLAAAIASASAAPLSDWCTEQISSTFSG